MKLVDTDVAIDYLRDDARAASVLEPLTAGSVTLVASEQTSFELLAGMRAGERTKTEDFFEELLWIPVDETIARLAGALARRFRPSHQGIDDADFFIAATALDLGADLLTRNVRHFPMLAGLRPAY